MGSGERNTYFVSSLEGIIFLRGVFFLLVWISKQSEHRGINLSVQPCLWDAGNRNPSSGPIIWSGMGEAMARLGRESEAPSRTQMGSVLFPWYPWS